MWKTIKYWNIQDNHTKKPHIPIPQNCSHWHFMGALTLFFFFFLKGRYWLAYHQFFWNIGHSPIEAPLWTTIWDKSEVLLGTYWGTNWKLEEYHGDTYGTWWEQGEKEKNSSSPPPPPPPFQKEKNWTPDESMLSLSFAAWNFYFQNCLSRFLALANGRKEKEKNRSLISALWAFHWLHATLFVSKTIYHHFWSRLIPPGRPLHSMKRLLIGCMKILLLKLAATNFGLPKKTLPIDL